jgi:hypothetical protein
MRPEKNLFFAAQIRLAGLVLLAAQLQPYLSAKPEVKP